VSWVAARTNHRALVGSRGREWQEFGQGCGSGLMHGRANGHFDGFQIETPRFAATGEDRAQELLYFARHFLVDRCGRFFSSGESVSWTGRVRQILSFTSNNS